MNKQRKSRLLLVEDSLALDQGVPGVLKDPCRWTVTSVAEGVSQGLEQIEKN